MKKGTEKEAKKKQSKIVAYWKNRDKKDRYEVHSTLLGFVERYPEYNIHTITHHITRLGVPYKTDEVVVYRADYLGEKFQVIDKSKKNPSVYKAIYLGRPEKKEVIDNKLGENSLVVEGEDALKSNVVNKTYANDECQFTIQEDLNTSARYQVEVSEKEGFKIIYSRSALTAKKVIELANEYKIKLSETK
jgi:hypothetical protein